MVMVAVDDELGGALELRASIRPEVCGIVQGLRERGIEHIAIISGDHEAPTRKLAEELGMDRYFAQVLPGDKADYVEQLQREGRKVCFVGDGINDAIALKKANVSISLRGATSIATDTAHVVFMEQGLGKLCELRDIARDLERNVRNSWIMILVPNITCVAGVFTLGFGIGASVVTNNVAALGALANGLLPMRKVAQLEAERRHQFEMQLRQSGFLLVDGAQPAPADPVRQRRPGAGREPSRHRVASVRCIPIENWPLLPIENAGGFALIARTEALAMAKTRPGSRMSQDQAATEEGTVIELPVRARPRKSRPSGPPRFRIFIIDSGWNSVARRVLRHNFALVRRLHKEDPIYLLSRKKSRDFIHRHRSLIGRDPIIAVHDLDAVQQHGNAGFHGFHLHLGVLRTPRQALTALQAFARFLRVHRAITSIWRRTFAVNSAARASSARSKSSSTRCRASSAGKAEAGEPICSTESVRSSRWYWVRSHWAISFTRSIGASAS